MRTKEEFEKIIGEIYDIPKNIHPSVFQAMGGLPAFEPIIDCMTAAYNLALKDASEVADVEILEHHVAVVDKQSILDLMIKI